MEKNNWVSNLFNRVAGLAQQEIRTAKAARAEAETRKLPNKSDELKRRAVAAVSEGRRNAKIDPQYRAATSKD